MFLFNHHVVRWQMVVLVVSLLLLAGCITTLPASPEADVPAPAETTDQAVTQSDVRPAQLAGVMPEQLQDLSAVAEYQSRLSGGEFGEVDTRGWAAVEAVPDQIADHQALADYQARLSDLWR
jgi:uncharacterized lipoprotein YajG